ncbi:MAG: hypothetical protein PHS54_04730 [Clostridia bacterium]|nr:hypothetical protein [Clostridia bacterium]
MEKTYMSNFRYGKEIKKALETFDINISEFVREVIEKELLTKEYIEEKRKYYNSKLKELDELEEVVNIKDKKLKEKKEEFLNATKKAILNNPEVATTRAEMYKNLFKEEITPEELMEICCI